jgi:hypothetical protein
MTIRRAMLVIAVLAVLENSGRLFFALWHGRAPFPTIPLVVLSLGVLIAAALGALYWSAKDQGRWLPSIVPAMASGVFCALLAVGVSTYVERTYGWALFVLVPFVIGLHSTLALSRRRPIFLGDALVVSSLALLLFGGILLAVAVEGLICLVMAAPIALPVALLGGAVGYGLRHQTVVRNPAMFLLLAGLTPFGATAERALDLSAEIFPVTTSIDLPASLETVWQTVLQPAKLAPPEHPLFRAGVAYPLASHIEGAGPTATRYCDFSTGKLVEPVLVWDDLRRLRFTVASNPLPMQEWTPYARLHPPHLDGFLVSRQGEFRLEPLANGGTRLYATTWYQHHLWPAQYWKLWSDYIIHQVHGMVLENIAQRAAAGS